MSSQCDSEKARLAKHAPLAIVGIGCVFPKAGDTTRFWANIQDGVDAIGPVPDTHWKPEDYFDEDKNAPDMTYARRGGFISPVEFDALEYGISPNNIEATDTTHLMGLMCTRQALSDAGYETFPGKADGRLFDRKRTSVILGVTGTLELVIPLGARLGHPKWRKALKDAGVDAATSQDVVERIADSYVPWQENSFPGLLGNVTAGRIANKFDLGGTNCVVDAACASSLSAVHMAAMELHSRQSDMVITGGVDTFNDIFMYMCFSKTPALSPTGDCRPFSKNADGSILGEGIGLVVIKRMDDAIAAGDRIYATIKGIGASSDGAGNAVYAPSAEGQMRALRDAYANAGITPDTIELVEAHGTGTKVGDAIEINSLTTVFMDGKNPPSGGKAKPWCAVGSVKSMIGHTKAAAGSAGLIKAALALHHRVLPPTLKVDEPASVLIEEDSSVYVNVSKRPWAKSADHPRRAAISAFGFGGSNFHCVLEEAPASGEQDARVAGSLNGDDAVAILPFSGDSKDVLAAALKRVGADPDWEAIRALSHDLRQAFSGKARCRLVVVLHQGNGDAAKALGDALKMLGSQDRDQWSTPDGIFYSSAPPDGKLAILFPGQGAQRIDMLIDLACQSRPMQDTLDHANAIAAQYIKTDRLSDVIYPPSLFDKAARQKTQTLIGQTQVTQPALGAVSYGAFQTLRQFGVDADAYAGHSYGELVALCAAGRFNEQVLFELSCKRGQLMSEQSADGGMLAVALDRDELATFIKDQKLDLVIANHNTPSQVVLSGHIDEIKKAGRRLKAAGHRATQLNVSSAFHTSFVSDAAKPFEAFVSQLGISEAAGGPQVFANTTGDVYPADSLGAQQVLGKQLACSVEFVKMIQTMYQRGVRCFAEVGPGRVLTGMVKAILGNQPFSAIALDHSKGSKSGVYDLGLFLAQLACAGHTVDLPSWDPASRALAIASKKPRKGSVTVTISGANYQQPRDAKPPTKTRPLSVQSSSTNAQLMNNAPDATVPLSPQASQALAATQQSILALQQMQEQTALLHRQYLEGQAAAGQTIQHLVSQQQQLLGLGGNVPVAPLPAAPVTPVAPVVPAATQPLVPPPVAIVPQPVATPAHAVPSAAQADQAKDILFEVVADKTGYPTEMLEIDMSLDADLGIDSIKRVEILSALQERMPAIPPVKPEDLGALQTLQQIVDYLNAPADQKTLPVPTAQPAAPSSTTDYTTVLLEVVSEKTGYPQDMLDIEMSLDADLGIDSIKRVEILSALQELIPDAPAVKPDDLGKLATLRQIVDYLSASTDSATSQAAPEGPAETAPTGSPAVDAAPTEALSFQGLNRQMLEASAMDPQATGQTITLEEGAAVWVTDDCQGLGKAVCELLRAKGLNPKLADHARKIKANQPLGALILIPPAKAGGKYVGSAFSVIKRVGPNLLAQTETGPAILVTVSMLDGQFGLSEAGPTRPFVGGLAGLLKTASHEWPKVSCKAIDLADDFESIQARAQKLVDEIFTAGPLEVGLSASSRYALTLNSAPVGKAEGEGLNITAKDAIVVSGGGRGVTAEVAVALARKYPAALVLLGRRGESVEEPAWLSGLRGETSFRKAIMANSSTKLTPKDVQEQCGKWLGNRQLNDTLRRIRSLGRNVVYRSVDVRDADAVERVVGEVRTRIGSIAGIVHGAGILEDRFIADKRPDQFDRVYGTKVEGLEALLKATTNDPLKFMVMFSSSTARFGRKGQVDYAAANEVLNKMAQQQARRRLDCRVLSINWGPWAGGMVNEGLKQLFAQEGVGLIPLEAGAEYLVHEIENTQNPAVEIVILGATLGAPEMTQTPTPRTGAARSNAVSVRSEAIAGEKETVFKGLHLAYEDKLSVAHVPVLKSHVMKGQAVLPMALMVEWMAHAAMHDNPGLKFSGFDDLKVFKGVTLEAEQEVTVSVYTGGMDGQNRVAVELRCGETLHAHAQILLAETLRPARGSSGPVCSGPYLGRLYQDARLFHGPDLQAIIKVTACDESGIVAETKTSPLPSKWLSQPLRSAWLSDPMSMDAAFQMMILWSFQQTHHGSLPTGVGRYRQFVSHFPKDPVRVVIRVVKQSLHAAEAMIEFTSMESHLLARIDGYTCVIDASLAQAFKQNQLAQSVGA